MKIKLQSYRKMLVGTRSGEETGLIYNSWPVQKQCKRCKKAMIFFLEGVLFLFVFWGFFNCLVFLVWLGFFLCLFFFFCRSCCVVFYRCLQAEYFCLSLKGSGLVYPMLPYGKILLQKQGGWFSLGWRHFILSLWISVWPYFAKMYSSMHFKNLIAFNGAKQNM